MLKTLSSEHQAIDPILLSLKPRQVVLLSNLNTMKKPSTDHKDKDKKPLLLQAVAHFLDCNGFSKTLKKFRSEAQLEVCVYASVCFPRN
jgi:hypothetical protein